MCAPCLRQYPSPFTALTNLTSPYLTNMALKIHQIILDYSTPANKQSDLFTVSRTLVSLLSGELVNEAYMQLLVGLSGMEKCCYHLIAVLLPFYPPSGRVLVYLRMYLEAQNASSKSRFPAYCLRMLQRSIADSSAKITKSELEISAVRPPYSFRCVRAVNWVRGWGLGVCLGNQTNYTTMNFNYTTINSLPPTGFDPSSSVVEVISDLELSLGIRPAR
eukprot:sb/3469874/